MRNFFNKILTPIKNFFLKFKNPFFSINVSLVVICVIVLQLMFPYVWNVLYYSFISFINGLVNYFNGITGSSYNSILFYSYIQNNNYLSIDLPINSSNDFLNLIQGIFLSTWTSKNFSNSIEMGFLLVMILQLIPFIIAILFIFKSLFSSGVYFEKDPSILGYTRQQEKFIYRKQKYLWKIRDFYRDLKSNFKQYKLHRLYILIALIYFNLLSAILLVIGYLLAICGTFSFIALYEGVYSIIYIFIDYFMKIHWSIILIALWLVWNKLMKTRAKNLLYKYDYFNKEYTKRLGTSTYISGPSGSGKSTIQTALAIYAEEINRQTLFEKMKKCMAYYPNFNFQLLNQYLNYVYQKQYFKNRFQIRDHIKKVYEKKLNRFYHIYFKYGKIQLEKKGLFNRFVFNSYNYIDDKMIHFDGLKEYSFIDTIVLYCECYFLFIRNCLGIISNIPIATPLVRLYEDYLITYQNQWNEYEKDDHINYQISGIINFDSMRLGKKVNTEVKPPIIDSLVFVIDEIDKERGNQFDTKHLKKDDKEANQLNDELKHFVNTTRHGNLSDNSVIVKGFMTSQRTGDTASSLVQACETVIDIQRIKQKKNTYKKHCIVRRHIAESLYNVFDRLDYRLMQTRNYIGFKHNIYKQIASFCFRYLEYIDNRYGYEIATLFNKDPREQKADEKAKFFIINRRVYANNFTSNALESIYESLAMNADTMFEFEMKYRSMKQTLDELRYQNSYNFERIEKRQFNNKNINVVKMFDSSTEKSNYNVEVELLPGQATRTTQDNENDELDIENELKEIQNQIDLFDNDL